MYLTPLQLHELGLKEYGKNVLISDKCSIISPQNISLGSNVRIDDFCILSAGTRISIGNHVHIGCHSYIVGKGEVVLEDFVTVSGRVSMYSSTDDYLGLGMTGPTVPDEYRKVTNGDIIIHRHAIIACGTVILPNVEIGMGASVGALSLVKGKLEECTLYAGNPLQRIGLKFRKFLEFEKYVK
jgi:acetyltransferase-like isoleucine patch superfamily enzyme